MNAVASPNASTTNLKVVDLVADVDCLGHEEQLSRKTDANEDQTDPLRPLPA